MPDVFKTPSDTTQPLGSLLPETPHTHYFASFCDHPGGITFQSQDPDETILLFLRKHFITNVPWILITIVLLSIPFLLSFIFASMQLNTPFTDLPPRFTTTFLLFYYLLVFAYVFIEFITWYYNVSIVTQKRIVDIDFSELVFHDVAMTKLSLIEDVNYTQVGFFRSLFDFGDVFVQTAGNENLFDFLAVPKPKTVVDIIEGLIGKGAQG